MYQEKREEGDLPASKTALMHQYNDSKTTEENTTRSDYIHEKQYWQHDTQQNDNN